MSHHKEKSNSLGQGLLKALNEIVLFEGGKGNLRTTSVEKPEVSVDSLLKGIGCNMMAEYPLDMSPEECLVELSPFLLQDSKALVLAIGAVVAHALAFNPDGIMKAMQVRKCDFNVIGALLSKGGEDRFRQVIDFCRGQKFISATPAKSLTLALKIGHWLAMDSIIARMSKGFEKKPTKLGEVVSSDSLPPP